MTQPAPRSSAMNIHLTIHKSQEDVHVDFPFDIENDNIDDVVSALVETAGLTEDDRESIKALMKKQIDSMASDGEPIDDPEYTKLLEEQKQELAELDRRHAAEQDALLKKLMGKDDDDLLIFN